MSSRSRARAFCAVSLLCLSITTLDLEAAALPEGEGRELVAAVCTACHDERQMLRSSGYGAPEWAELTGTMIDLSANADDRDVIIRYLAKHFPPNDRRAPKLVARRGEDRVQAMAGADARPTVA